MVLDRWELPRAPPSPSAAPTAATFTTFPGAALATATALFVSGRLVIATGVDLVVSILVVVLTIVFEVEVRDVKETGLTGPDVYESGLDTR